MAIKKSLRGYKKDSPDRNRDFNLIPSGKITMKDVLHPVLGIDNLGNKQLMMPEEDYEFPGDQVLEIPMKKKKYQFGGSIFDFLFDEEEEDSPKQASAPDTEEVEEQSQRPVQDNSDYDAAMAIAMEDSPFRRRSGLQGYDNKGRSILSPDQSYDGNAVAVNGTADYAFKYYQNKGLPPHVAAGIVGNLMQESQLNPHAVGDNGVARGIGQWHPDRFSKLANFANSQGKNPYDLNTQLDFVINEPGESQRALQAAMKAKNSGEAALIWGKTYERPKVVEKTRAGYAKKLNPYREGGYIN